MGSKENGRKETVILTQNSELPPLDLDFLIPPTPSQPQGPRLCHLAPAN